MQVAPMKAGIHTSIHRSNEKQKWSNYTAERKARIKQKLIQEEYARIQLENAQAAHAAQNTPVVHSPAQLPPIYMQGQGSFQPSFPQPAANQGSADNVQPAPGQTVASHGVATTNNGQMMVDVKGVAQSMPPGQNLHVIFTFDPSTVNGTSSTVAVRGTGHASPAPKSADQEIYRGVTQEDLESMVHVEQEEPPDHTVKIAIFVFFLNLVIGIIVYTQVEGWSAVDAIYFSLVTLTTVGYGDMGPTKAGSKIFTCVYILLCLIVGATAIGIVVGHIMEQQERAMVEAAEAMEDDGDDSEEDGEDGLTAEQWALVNGVIIWFVLVAIGMGVMVGVEELSAVDAFYFSIVTTSTVGYGDFSPSTTGGKVFWMFWGIISVSAFANMQVKVSGLPIAAKQAQMMERKLHQTVSAADILGSDRDGDGLMDESEFILFKLDKMGMLDMGLISKISSHFHAIDADGSGKLTMEEAMKPMPKKKGKKK